MNLPGFAVHRPVTVVMIFLAVILFGLFSLTRLPIDLYPEIELPTITVITTYPGASALEVEEKVTQLIEGEVAIVGGIKSVRSVSKENISSVSAEFHYGTDLDDASSEIRDHLEFIRSRLPVDADSPMVLKINTAMFPVVMMAIYRDEGDVFADYDLVEDLIIDRLKSLEGVGNVTVFNATPQRVEIRVDRSRLDLLGLTLQDLVDAIQLGNVSAPAGSLEVGIGEFALELKGEYRTLEELRSTVVGMGLGGGLVYLGDVAEVAVAYKELDEVAVVNGRPSLFTMVNKRSGANTVAVARGVTDYLEKLEDELPAGLHAEVVYDLSTFIVSMIDNLTQTVYLGGIFVILVVLLFLRNLRSSIIIAVAIPASLVAAFGGLALFGYTINMFSLMSLAVAIGMVVDNAIVVLENISRHREMGEDRRQASRQGGFEVAGAVLASTLTSVSIFGPLVFISGFVGVLFNQLAFVVIIVLTASLLVSLLLTPALSSWFLSVAEKKKSRRRGFGGVQGGLAGRLCQAGDLIDCVQDWYAARLRGFLRHPWRVIFVGVALFAGTFLLAGTLGSGFMPKQDVADISVALELPVGTTTDETARMARQVLEVLQAEMGPWIVRTYYRAGASEEGIGSAFGQREGPHIAEVGVRLVPVNERPLTTQELGERLRPRIAALPELKYFSIMTDSPLTQVFSGGERPLTVRLKGTNLETLKAATETLRAAVAGVSGTVEVTGVVPEERPEIRVEVDRLRASRMGIPMAVAASALRAAFYGLELGTFRANGNELDLFLQLRKEDRDRPAKSLELPLRTGSGERVRLGNLATLEEGTTPIEINRTDQQRSTRVEGDVAGRPLGEVTAEIQARLRDLDLGGATVEFGGDIEEQQKTAGDFMLVLVMGIALVYMVMAGQFESFLDPLVIMVSVPFAFSGVILGLFVTGTDLTVPAFMGLIMLVGIVVNNAIVLLEFIKQLRAQGRPLHEAIVEGGRLRLRPVAMTTLTTIFGMVPMAVAGGEGHEMWRPMGIAVISGLLFSTLVTLVLVPVVYSKVARFSRTAAGAGDEPARDRPDLDQTDPGTGPKGDGR